MRKSALSEEQIATALRQTKAGAPIAEITPKLGVNEQAYYLWPKKCRQMGVAEIRRLPQFEEMKNKFKQPVVALTLDKVMLQQIIAKKSKARTQASTRTEAWASRCQPCRVIQLVRSTWAYHAHWRHDQRSPASERISRVRSLLPTGS